MAHQPVLIGAAPNDGTGDDLRDAFDKLNDNDAELYDRLDSDPWTPVLTFVTPGNLSVAYSAQEGLLTRDAEDFILWWRIVTSTFTHTTASGNLRITGVPTPPNASPANLRYVGSMVVQGITKANYTQFMPVIAPTESFIQVQGCGSGQSLVAIATGDVPSGGSVVLTGSIRFRR